MSTSSTPKTYENLQIIDPSEPIWVSPIDYETCLERVEGRNLQDDYIILIGPTGSGKSSFIEAIASMSTRKPLGIAKDQLESVTQEACIYEIKNLKDKVGDRICIIDTPGFADPRISELQVLDKITYWRDRRQGSRGYVRLLYFHSITDIRVPASRKQCIDMIKCFWGRRLRTRALLVTSMWDCVPERSRNATEKRFTQLSTTHWRDWITEGTPAIKFANTFDSAMEILNRMCTAKDTQDEYPIVSGLGIEGTIGNPVYEALFSRISSLQQQRETRLEDLARPESQSQMALIGILTRDLNQTNLLLQKFTTEMENLLKRLSPRAIESPPAIQIINYLPVEWDADASASPSAIPLPDFINTTSLRFGDRTFPPTIEVVGSQKLSLPKRFSQWAHKKIDRIHLEGSRRKGH